MFSKLPAKVNIEVVKSFLTGLLKKSFSPLFVFLSPRSAAMRLQKSLNWTKNPLFTATAENFKQLHNKCGAITDPTRDHFLYKSFIGHLGETLVAQANQQFAFPIIY